MNKEIEKYLKSKNKDYIQGVQLYARFGKNKSLTGYFNHAESVARKDKLIYELSKIAEVEPPAPAPIKSSPVIKDLRSKQSTKPSAVGQGPEVIIIGGDGKKVPFNALPLVVQEVIKQKGKLYRKREDLHEQLKKVPQDNKAANKKKREDISNHMNHLSKRIDVLYAAQLAYEKSKKLPNESILDWDQQPATSNHQQDLMPDHSKMSDVDLKNRITNLRTYITRDENQLKYQSRKKEEKANPMPDGPKKEKIKKKIDLRKAEVEKIEADLKKRQKK